MCADRNRRMHRPRGRYEAGEHTIMTAASAVIEALTADDKSIGSIIILRKQHV